MEPKQDVFLPYLAPLLDAPSSRYVLRSWHDQDQWVPQKYIDEGLIASPEFWKEKGHQHSPILILANLADQAFRNTPGSREPTNRGSHSHIKAIDLAHAVRLKSAFEAYGPTRVLMWMPDAEKRPLLPTTVSYRGKLAAYAESAFHLEEIAGAAYVPSRKRREDYLDIESSKIVAKRMEEDQIQIPPERQVKPTTTSTVFSSKTRVWHAKLAELDEAFKTFKLPQFIGKPPGPLVPPQTGPKAPRVTPEYKRYVRLQATYKSQNKSIDEMNQILHRQEEIDRLDLAAHREGIDKTEQEHELEAIDPKIKAFKDEVNRLLPNDRERLTYMDDDRRAFALDPPLLSWDRRRAESLLVQPDEFYPPKELALLDFQPLPPEKQFPMTSEQSLYFDVICTNLFGPRGIATLEHLNHIAPGAYEALVPKCPAVTDPHRGGRRDVESMRVRNLTPEMLWQLAIAWDEWLFKPSMSDLLTQFGANFEYDYTKPNRSRHR